MFDRFIVEIQDRPALYNAQSKDYANRELRKSKIMDGQERDRTGSVAHWADLIGPRREI